MTSRSRRARLLAAATGLVALVVSACGSDTAATTSPTVTKTTASFAEAPGAQPNYIFPLASFGYFSVGQPEPVPVPHVPAALRVRFERPGPVEQRLSLAYPPVYSSDGKSVTVTLKGWKWSDGTPITARDVQFWQNLVTANKDNWAGYSPGEYPDNVDQHDDQPEQPLQITFNLTPGLRLVLLHLQRAEPDHPAPPAVWDRESATGAVGNYDKTPAGAQAVYKFLDYAVEDDLDLRHQPALAGGLGPWKLKSMDTAGNVSMVPNPATADRSSRP